MTDDTATAPQSTLRQNNTTKPKHRGLNRWSGASLALLLAVLGLAAGRLGLLWPDFDVFTQLTAQFIMALAAFALALFVPRQKTLTGIVLLILMAVAYGMWPHYVSARPEVVAATPPGTRAVKIASFNTWRDNRSLAALEAEINRLDADVLVLTEFSRHRKDMAERLRARYPYQFNCHSLLICSLMIVSRTPLADTAISPDLGGNFYIRARLGRDMGNVTVFAVHTLRFPHSRMQFVQAAALRKDVAATAAPVLVMGDFNATPFSRLISAFQQETGLARLTSLPSWPAGLGLPQIAIDHIFASPSLKPLSAERIGDNAGSDHYPVSMTLAVPVP